MDPDKQFEFEGLATPSEAADTLAQIAEGVRTGSVSLAVGRNGITIFALAWRHPRVKGH